MPLPSIDFELVYWRLRRRLQRIRGALRALASRIRAQRDLEYLHRFGRLPEQLEPEETFAFRLLMGLAIVGTVFALSLEATDTFLAKAHADALVMQPHGTERNACD